ncbi:MAG: histidine kinase [Pseudomonadales bacterium]
MSISLLPNLCRLPLLLATLLVTEWVVILYVFSLSPLGSFDWQRLSLLSLYAQWISLLSLAGLCQLRASINRQSAKIAGLLSFGWIVGVATLSNIAAQWVYAGGSWQLFSATWLLRDGLIIAVLAVFILRYLYVQQSWRAEQKAAHAARLDALYARIRPHFLFNSMNTIASLIRYAPDDAERAVEDLATLFRASLSQNDHLVSWQQELGICLAYLRIEQQRLGERLQVEWQLMDVPECCRLPPLSLQPLIENAIYHGIESLAAGGTIVIRVNINDDVLRIDVENPCEKRRLTSFGSTAKTHNGVALDNIRARLAAIYHTADDRNAHYKTTTSSKPISKKPSFKSAGQPPLAELVLNTTEASFTATLMIPMNLPARASKVDGEQ